MDQFLKFIENREFVRWALNPDEESEKTWTHYLATHPDEKQAADSAAFVIRTLRSKREAINEGTALTLYSEIMCKIGKTKKRKSFRFASVFKYAAIALVFFGVGALTNHLLKKDSWMQPIPLTSELNNLNEARLVLSDGKFVPLNDKETVIDYRNGGDIIINYQDTIKPAGKEKIPEMNQLVIPFGKSSSLKLADGTVVYLNSGSRLIYPDHFTGKTREVILFGEAFFDVATLPGKTFVVSTNDVVVEVLGTMFNISAYPSDKMVETVLVKGSVRVTEHGGNKILRKEYFLQPSEMASFNRETRETSVKPVDINNYVSWHQGYLNFESIDLSRIVKRLERYYDISVRIENPMLGQLKISGKLKLKEDLDKVLNVVATTASLGLVKINDRYYVLK